MNKINIKNLNTSFALSVLFILTACGAASAQQGHKNAATFKHNTSYVVDPNASICLSQSIKTIPPANIRPINPEQDLTYRLSLEPPEHQQHNANACMCVRTPNPIGELVKKITETTVGQKTQMIVKLNFGR